MAALVSLPGLGLPFLSDDWAQIEAVSDRLPHRTPFGDFRPLYMATLWLDRRVWGLAPAGFHLTNLVLIAAAAALVVAVVRRYTTDDSRIAAAAGVLFALHPYHVENAAWVGARSDPLYAIPFLLSIVAYDRWRDKMRAGPPVLAIVLFEAALLAKELAVSLPVFLVTIGLVDGRRRACRREWARGLLPIVGVALLHFLVLRRWALGGPGRTLLHGFGIRWVKDGLGLAAAAILPADVEILAARPVLWGSLAIAAVLGLILVARTGSGRIPRVSLAAAAMFFVLLGPAVVGFEERYLFVPAAASGAGIASLLLAARRRWAAVAAALLLIGWVAALGVQWMGWREAAIASERLVAELGRASRREGVREIVVANMPFRVWGGSVAGDFRAALGLRGDPPVTVRALAYFSYPSACHDALDGPVRRPPPVAEARFRVARAPFHQYVGPRPEPGVPLVETRVGTIAFEADGGIRTVIRPDALGGRAAYVWARCQLEPLF